jgi:hypothetical protein
MIVEYAYLIVSRACESEGEAGHDCGRSSPESTKSKNRNTPGVAAESRTFSRDHLFHYMKSYYIVARVLCFVWSEVVSAKENRRSDHLSEYRWT